MSLIHKGMLKVSVSVKCLVEVKMYGNKPIILLQTINKKKVTKIIVPDELFIIDKILNSDLNFVKIEFITIKVLFGIIQKIGRQIDRINIVLIQLMGIIKKEDGSKTENKLFIIFNVFGGGILYEIF
jgi:hypothetical protein